jgi:hypothetical protein
MTDPAGQRIGIESKHSEQDEEDPDHRSGYEELQAKDEQNYQGDIGLLPSRWRFGEWLKGIRQPVQVFEVRNF